MVGSESAPVLLGVGDDDHLGALVDRTADLALERHAPVVAVHVVHRSEVWALAALMVDSRRYLQTRRRRLERAVLTPLRDRGVEARLVVRLGEPAHQLAAIASACGADLVVIGAEAHDRKHHHLVGSGLAHRLGELTTVPVETVAFAAEGAGARRVARTV